ncbi:MAG: protein kinase, partial [Myxococcales bacterium]|nr:protein kinase [Myxococcales bacterium]
EREAKVLAGLDHPGVPKTRDFFLRGGRWIMVQSRAPGSSLAARIEAGERFEASALESLLREGLEILAYLHGLHPPVIHRDIKPGNVMVDRGTDGSLRVSLVDFGAIQARVRGADSVASTSVGTFGFIPMEQMIGQARPASDLFALAMTVVVAASHRWPEALPLDEGTGRVDLDALGLQLSPALRRTLEAMLEPIVGKRVATAQEALRLLSPAGAALAVPTTMAVAQNQGEVRLGWLWNGCMGLSGLAAGLIYLVFFDAFSETALIQISALWVAPFAFGFAGRLAERNGKRHPVGVAMLWAGAAVAALIFFIYGIFPSL